MEKRAILAAILMVGLLVLYQALFAPVPPPSPPAEPVGEPQTAPPSPVPTRLPLPAKLSTSEPIPQRRVVVQTPLYRGVLASDGGRVLEWVLHYRGEKPLVVPGVLGSKGLTVWRAGGQGEVLGFQQVSASSIRLGAEQPRGLVRLAGQDAFGLRVSEELEFHADDYRVEVHIRVENRHTVPQAVELLLPWAALEKWPEGEVERFQGQRPTRVVWLDRDGVHREALEDAVEASTDGQWVGLESEWYVAAMIPESPGFTLAIARNGTGAVEIGLRASPPPLAPGQAWEGRVLLYVGPKEYDRLKALGVGLEQTIHFGTLLKIPFLRMQWIAIPLLWLMNFFYRYIPNYGVAIILLTVITKVLFYPLTLKSMGSMKAMQALQPQINALRAKHQKDAQRLQQETMALYRKHGVNPLGGCLPMVIQIPIFYSLYLVFSLAVELQNAAFLCFGRLFGVDLWICDLAQRDPTYVLPILMGGSMFIQQKMMPVTGDPRQAKIMLMMPVVFTFMFLKLPSGLVLYWFVSNVLQIVQQRYINLPAKPRKELRQAG